MGTRWRSLNTLELGIHVEQAQPSLTHGTHLCEPFQAVVPRIGASITFFGTAVVRQFEQMLTLLPKTSPS